MNNLKHLNKLAGQKLIAVHVVQEYFSDTIRPMNIALLFKFKKFNCLIEAVSSDDTIYYETGKNLQWSKNIENIKTIDISNSKFWKECISKNVIWAWQLMNQQGYEDGIQFCFNNNKKEIIRQIIVKASELNFYKFNK